MNVNRKVGTGFERDLCLSLSGCGFWAHNLAQNSQGQPFDVIAARNGVSYPIDCKDCFWLQVDGDSMSPVLDDHDLVLVKKDTPPETDTLMVVIVDDEEGFVKKISIDEDTVTLRSFNPHYPPVFLAVLKLDDCALSAESWS